MIENDIKSDLGDAEEGFAQRWRVTWRKATRSTFDVKAYKAAHPGEDLTPYYKTTASRRFVVKKIEED